MKLTNIVWHQFNYDRAIINNSCREMFWNSSQVIIQEQRMGMVLTHYYFHYFMPTESLAISTFTHDITGFIDK